MSLLRSRTTERHGAVLDYLAASGEASIAALSRDLGVSEVSVRRDLEELAQKGLIQRVRGGARSVTRPGQVSVFDARLRTNTATKAAIGRLAASLIEPGDSVLLDSGTTVLEVARHLSPALLDGGLTVVTRSLSIASLLRSQPRARLFVLGGMYLHEYDTFVGEPVQQALSGIHVRALFMGSDGISLQRGLTTDNVMEAPLFRSMAGIAEQVIVVADSRKIGVDKLQITVPFERVSTFVTDAAAPQAFLEMLTDRGIRVAVAGAE